ncbi:DUF1430 domain-containing protein [Fundicoccus culcitae]|uniref:DUF1430 domain-containing protein n=1 Tax=Fundicoccus culcitae TaxID=2969821 RepID=A0ABY5P679_9LACT|nr:DUF1430 domain-containing protein [Fundicoccus culcitae]UUX34239.1 DUF1430 domain-containing protein [Fundicoccus culcitae]
MKTIIKAIFVLLLVVPTLMLMNLFQTNDYERLQTIEQTEFSENFYLTDASQTIDEVLNEFAELSEINTVNIFKTDSSDGAIVKSVMYNEQSFPTENFGIPTETLFENTSDVYTSFAEDRNNMIPVFSSRNKIILQTLENNYLDTSKSVNGIYTVVANNNEDLDQTMDSLSEFFAIDKSQLTSPPFKGKVGYININLILMVVVFCLAFLILLLFITYYPIKEIKAIGVMKLHGYSSHKIIFQLIKEPLLIGLVACIILSVVIFSTINYIPEKFVLALLLTYFLVFQLFLLLNLAGYFLIRNVTISSMLNGFSNFKSGVILSYMIKIGLVAIITLIFINLSLTFDAVKEQSDYVANWEKEGDFLTVENYRLDGDSAQNELLSDDAFDAVFYDLFVRLEEETNAYYVHGLEINPIQNFSALESYSSFTTTDSYNVMLVNHHYLDSINMSYPELDSNIHQFLIPENLRNEDEKIRLLCQSLVYYFSSSNQVEDMIISEIPVQLFYYQSDYQVFPFNSMLSEAFENPIFSIVNLDNIRDFDKAILANTGENNPIKINNTLENRLISENIFADIYNEHDVMINLSSLNVITQAMRDSFITGMNYYIIIIVILIVLNLFSSAFLFATIIQSVKKELAVKKFLGIKVLDRYKWPLLSYVLLYLIQMLMMLILSHSVWILLAVLLSIAIDFLVVLVFIHYLEQKSLVLALKEQ